MLMDLPVKHSLISFSGPAFLRAFFFFFFFFLKFFLAPLGQDLFVKKKKKKKKKKQREKPVWGELAEYLEGGKIPTRRLPRATLEQFALEDGLLCYVKEKADDSLHYIIIPRSLVVKVIYHAHESSGHLGQNYQKG